MSDAQVEPAVPHRPHRLPEGTDLEREAPAEAPSTTPRVQSPFSPDEEDLVAPLTLVLLRHGVTEMTTSRRMSGSGVPGPALSAAGRVQAAKAADLVYGMGRRTWMQLPHVTRVLASPMVRTQETAGAVGRRVGAHVETEPGIKEVDFGVWEGLTVPEIAERDGDAIHRWRRAEIAAPEGESIAEVGERGYAVVKRLAQEHAAECMAGRDVPRGIALVSHAVAIKSIVGTVLGMPASQWGLIWPSPASTSVLQVRARYDGSIAETHVLAVGVPVE
ncbi:histidine phosphatase family protein [Demequina mangrovi]|uniref:Probable phosphoglycerate mutase n=1 Tax=Demequina mangrovi TaxID=1043493 RepID=A0A1H6UNC1_9MICO|nr:histidine phosphatase family protein [Demequina mangrovi]SEI93873.1 probable phosphoglycerate mutase [Demequina mangrovi]